MMKINSPRSLLTYSLLPLLVFFLLGGILLLFAMSQELLGPFLLLGGGVLGGVLLTLRLSSAKKP